eukprot:6205619-Pleurochrysis_carterae.AAC.5
MFLPTCQPQRRPLYGRRLSRYSISRATSRSLGLAYCSCQPVCARLLRTSLARPLAGDAIVRACGARECIATTHVVSMRNLAGSNVYLAHIVVPSPWDGGGGTHWPLSSGKITGASELATL